jgi:hydrogenase maturation factor HypF (carbamoyltransferase family)
MNTQPRLIDVFTHRRTPANDGGVSLGQAAVANARLVAGRG